MDAMHKSVHFNICVHIPQSKSLYFALTCHNILPQYLPQHFATTPITKRLFDAYLEPEP